LVVIGTCIVPLYIAIIISLISKEQITLLYYWVLPILLSIILYLIWNANMFVTLSLMDGPVIVGISLLMMYCINIILLFSFTPTKKKRHHIPHIQIPHPHVHHIEQLTKERDYYKQAAHA